MKKDIVILAVSRKNNQYCIAGKEISNNEIGPWIRPVSRSFTGELHYSQVVYTNTTKENSFPQKLDIVSFDSAEALPKWHQTENVLNNSSIPWNKIKNYDKALLDKLVDTPDDLWLKHSSGNGYCRNSRIPHNLIGEFDTSLYFIKPNNVDIFVTYGYMRKKVLAFYF